MKITVAHSPDSDDAFMHFGLASGKVPTEGIEFGHLLADIETLNRAAFEDQIRRVWQQAQRDRQTVAVIMIDIDYFKAYNDHYGFARGDDILRLAAARSG